MWNPVTVRRAVPALLTVRQVAVALKVTTDTVRAMIRRGSLKATRPGLRQYRITRDELTRCLGERMRWGQSPSVGGQDDAPTRAQTVGTPPQPLRLEIPQGLATKDPAGTK